MKMYLIITLLLITAITQGLQARIIPLPDKTSENQVFEKTGIPNFQSTSCYGQNYYRKNSRHQYNMTKGSVLNLDNVDADVKIITWNRDYAEVEILKISPLSIYDLENKEVMISNDGDLTIRTCCSSPENCTMINLKIKLPVDMTLGEITSHEGNLCLKNMNNRKILFR